MAVLVSPVGMIWGLVDRRRLRRRPGQAVANKYDPKNSTGFSQTHFYSFNRFFFHVRGELGFRWSKWHIWLSGRKRWTHNPFPKIGQRRFKPYYMHFIKLI